MKEKLKTRDLIYAGAFGAIYLVLMLVIVMGSGMIPVLYILSPFTVGIICATVYMLYVCRIKKCGAIMILAVLFGVITMSNSIYSMLWALLVGVVAELIARAGQYRSKKLFMISYWVFNLTMIGPFMMLVYAKDAFIESCDVYYGTEYAQAIEKLTPDWIIFGLAGLAVVGAVIGTLLASRITKKHFEKAGIM